MVYCVMALGNSKTTNVGYTSLLPILTGVGGVCFFVAEVCSTFKEQVPFGTFAILGAMITVPVFVWMMLSKMASYNPGFFAKSHWYVPTVGFTCLLSSTLVGGIIQSCMFPGYCSILCGSLCFLTVGVQFLAIAGGCSHNVPNGAVGRADVGFKSLGAKTGFLVATTLSMLTVTLSVWNVGWSVNWNMFAFALCFSFFLITMTATWYSTKHYQTTKMSVGITIVATLVLFDGIAACCMTPGLEIAVGITGAIAFLGSCVILVAFANHGAGLCCYARTGDERGCPAWP